MFSLQSFNDRIARGGSGGGGGQYWQGSTPAPPAPPQAPASPLSYAGNIYQGPGQWLPVSDPGFLNQPQSSAIPSTQGTPGFYAGWGGNQFTTQNPTPGTAGMQAPTQQQTPQALLNSMYESRNPGAYAASIGQNAVTQNMGPLSSYGINNMGAPGSMGMYANQGGGGVMGANRWWNPAGRPWGT